MQPLWRTVWNVKVAQSCPTLATTRTIQSMEFSRPEYWSGWPAPSPGDLPKPGIEPRLLTLQADSLPAEPQGSPRTLQWVAYPFSSRPSRPGNRSRVSCLAGGVFTSWAIKEVQRTVCRVLKKLKKELPSDPAIPFLGIYLEKTVIQKDACTPMFTAALLTIPKAWRQPKCPSTEEWIKTIWCVCVY